MPKSSSANRHPLRKKSAQKCFSYEPLEDRRMLAANITLTDAFLIDGNLNPITSPVHGEQVTIRANWTTTDLPSNASYFIGFFVDGVELQSSQISLGAGTSTASGWWYRPGWYATGELQNVTVTIDVNETVAESTESDNTLSFSFSSQAPADLPQKLIWPLADAPYSAVQVGNYYDVDPTDGVRDYAGNTTAYNGHSAFDAGPMHFQYQDEGYDIFAAADGVVTYVHDGEFDRHTSWVNGAEGNAVKIDHGNGWETIYWHFRRDSINVKVGQSVSQGDLLGYMGSSGISTAMHVHFGLNHHGQPVEPMFAESDYFVSPFGNTYDNRYLSDSYTTNYWESSHLKEGFSQVDTYSSQISGQITRTDAQFSGLQTGDLIEFSWYRPDGTHHGTASATQPANYSTSNWRYATLLPDSPDVGTWRVDLKINGIVLGIDEFEVTANGATEIRIEDAGQNLIVDNRFTPLDFGEPTVGSPDPTMTLSVINHGSDILTLGNIELPANYYLVEGLPGTLGIGQSNTFTIALDTNTAGFHAGEIKIATNDADESTYNFSVEGFVNGGLSKLVLGISERSSDENQTLVANVRRPLNSSGALTVNLSADDNSELSFPESVVIPNGQEFVSFEIQTIDDGITDGINLVNLTATATGYSSATNSLEVLDEEPSPEIIDQYLVYDNSLFDNNEPGAGTSDDSALASKTGLLPGQTATFENYSSFSQGINSIAIDVNEFVDISNLDASDFIFKTGNGNNNSDFSDLGITPAVAIRTGEGINGSDRVTLSFTDETITNTWLQVTVLANAKTGLPQNHVFYFGSVIGETGDNPADTLVNIVDLASTRINQSGFSSVGLESDHDFNRDGKVNLVDIVIVRQNQSGFSSLNLITAPDGDSQSRSDGNDNVKNSGGSEFMNTTISTSAFESVSNEQADGFGEPNQALDDHHDHDHGHEHDHGSEVIDAGFEEFDPDNFGGSDFVVHESSSSEKSPTTSAFVRDISSTSELDSEEIKRNENRWRHVERDELVLSGALELTEIIDFT